MLPLLLFYSIPIEITAAIQLSQAIYCYCQYPKMRIPASVVAALSVCYAVVAPFGFYILVSVTTRSSMDPIGDGFEILFWHLVMIAVFFTAAQAANIWLFASFYKS